MSIKDITPYTKQNLKLACIFAVIGISIGFLGAKNTEEAVMIVGLTAIFFALTLIRLFYYQNHTGDACKSDDLIDLAYIQNLKTCEAKKGKQTFLQWLLRNWDSDILHTSSLTLSLDPKTQVYTCKSAYPKKDKVAIKTLEAACTTSYKASSRLVKQGKFEQATDKLLWETSPEALSYFADHKIVLDKKLGTINPLYQEEIVSTLSLIPSVFPLDIRYGVDDESKSCKIYIEGLDCCNFSIVVDDLQTQKKICRSFACRMSCMICEMLLGLNCINSATLEFCISANGNKDEVLCLMAQVQDISQLKAACRSKDIQAPEKLLDSMSL